MAQICKDGNAQITANFSEQELYSKSFDAPTCHFLSDKAIAGAQIIRDWAGVPVNITSTYRTEAGNTMIGGSSTSRHLDGAAIDLDFGSNDDRIIQDFYDDIKCKGPLYRQLTQAGVRGIGIYDSFIHIDERSTKSFWDDSAGKWGDTRVTSQYMAQVPDTGLNSAECGTLAETSDYGLEGFLAPLDPRNYSGEDGLKSQSQKLGYLAYVGIGLAVVGLGVIILNRSRRKQYTIVQINE